MSTIQALLGNDVVDLLLEVRHGDIPTMMIANVSGYLPLATATLSTVWSVGGLYTYPLDTPATISFVSDNVLDTLVSTHIAGLDADGYIQNETIVLNGTTPVVTANTYSRLLRVHTTGGKAFVGVIAGTANAVQITNIQPEAQATLFGFFTIPRGYTGFLINLSASVAAGKEATLSMVARPQGGVFAVGQKAAMYESSTILASSYERFEELTDIEMRAASLASGVTVSVYGSLLLVKNI